MLFVLGTGRCGSSLVHEVLVRHPMTGFVSNVDDRLPALNLLGRYNSQLFRHVPESLTRKGRPRFAPSEAYNLLDRQVSQVISKTFRDLDEGDATPWLTARLRAFFEARESAQRPAVFTHKFTGWPRARLLHAVFPRARFIHIVRDGRGVANSWLQMGWWTGYRGPGNWRWGPLSEADVRDWEREGRSHLALAALAWRMLVEAHETARRALPSDAWLELRYEDVVADPRSAFLAILDFAGLEWTDAFERGFARQRFRVGRREAFRDDLGEPGVALVERMLARPLARYGYTVASAESGIESQ